MVATKFPVRTQAEIDAGISGQEHVRRMLDKSLQNLGMDHVDLYIYHMWDYRTPLYEIMEGLNNAVKAGKARYIGISNCFAWQLCKANELARREGFAPFVSVQGHYNLIFREEEREMIPYCREEGIAVTPYSALAGGRLSKLPGETSKRLEQDAYAKGKYDATAAQDARIIERVAELARLHGVSMTEIALAWLMGKGGHSRGRSDQAQPCGRRGPRHGAGAHGGGNRLSGSLLHAPRAGGRDGAEHPGSGGPAQRLVSKHTQSLKAGKERLS